MCKRLVLAGFAEPAGKRRFAIAPDTPKAVLKAARVRPKG